MYFFSVTRIYRRNMSATSTNADNADRVDSVPVILTDKMTNADDPLTEREKIKNMIPASDKPPEGLCVNFETILFPKLVNLLKGHAGHTNVSILPSDVISEAFWSNDKKAKALLMCLIDQMQTRFGMSVIYDGGHYTGMMFDKEDFECTLFESLATRSKENYTSEMTSLENAIKLINPDWSVSMGKALLQPNSFSCGDLTVVNMLTMYMQKTNQWSWGESLVHVENMLECSSLKNDTDGRISSDDCRDFTLSKSSCAELRGSIIALFEKVLTQVEKTEQVPDVVYLNIPVSDVQVALLVIGGEDKNSQHNGGSDSDDGSKSDIGSDSDDAVKLSMEEVLMMLKQSKKTIRESKKTIRDLKKQNTQLKKKIVTKKNQQDDTKPDLSEPPCGFQARKKQRQSALWNKLPDDTKTAFVTTYKLFRVAEEKNVGQRLDQACCWKLLGVDNCKDVFDWINTLNVDDAVTQPVENWSFDMSNRTILVKTADEGIQNFGEYTDDQRDHVFQRKQDGTSLYPPQLLKRLLRLSSETLERFLREKDIKEQMACLKTAVASTFNSDMLLAFSHDDATADGDDGDTSTAPPYCADFSYKTVDPVTKEVTKVELKEWSDDVWLAIAKGRLDRCQCLLSDERQWEYGITTRYDEGSIKMEEFDYITKWVVPELLRRPRLVVNKGMVFNILKVHLQFYLLFQKNGTSNAGAQTFIVNGKVQIGKTGFKQMAQLAMLIYCRAFPDSKRMARCLVLTDKLQSAMGLVKSFRNEWKENGIYDKTRAEAEPMLKQQADLKKDLKDKQRRLDEENKKMWSQGHAGKTMNDTLALLEESLSVAQKLYEKTLNNDKGKMAEYETCPNPNKIVGLTPMVDKGHTQTDEDGKLLNMNKRRDVTAKDNYVTNIAAATAREQYERALELIQKFNMALVLIDEADIFTGYRLPEKMSLKPWNQTHVLNPNATGKIETKLYEFMKRVDSEVKKYNDLIEEEDEVFSQSDCMDVCEEAADLSRADGMDMCEEDGATDTTQKALEDDNRSKRHRSADSDEDYVDASTSDSDEDYVDVSTSDSSSVQSHDANAQSINPDDDNEEMRARLDNMESLKKKLTECTQLIQVMITATGLSTQFDQYRLKDADDKRLSDRITADTYCCLSADDGEMVAEIDGEERTIYYTTNYVSLKNYRLWYDESMPVYLPEVYGKEDVTKNKHVRAIFRDSLQKDDQGNTRRSCFMIVGNPGVASLNGINTWHDELYKYAVQESKKSVTATTPACVVPIFVVMSAAGPHIRFPDSEQIYKMKISPQHEGPPGIVLRPGSRIKGAEYVFQYKASQGKALPSDFLHVLHNLGDEFCKEHGITNDYPIAILGDSQCKRSANFTGSWGGITHYVNAQTNKSRSLDDVMQQFRGHGQCAGALKRHGWVDEQGNAMIRILTKESLWKQLCIYETLPMKICKRLENGLNAETLTSCMEAFMKQAGLQEDEYDQYITLFAKGQQPVFSNKTKMNAPVAHKMYKDAEKNQALLRSAVKKPPRKKLKIDLDDDNDHDIQQKFVCAFFKQRNVLLHHIIKCFIENGNSPMSLQELNDKIKPFHKDSEWDGLRMKKYTEWKDGSEAYYRIVEKCSHGSFYCMRTEIITLLGWDNMVDRLSTTPYSP